MANPFLSTGCYYHIYNRGVEKRKIYLDRWDYYRFSETVNFYSKNPTPMKLSDFRRGVVRLKKVEGQKELVKIYCYCLMPNHFHLLVQQLEENGISIFMRRLSDSYTRYFNTKHERVGSLFQGAFKAKLVENEEYLLQLSKYIHRNSFPLEEWEGRVYPHSSYGDYLSGRDHPLGDSMLILDYFSKNNPNLNYQNFVEGTEDYAISLFPALLGYDE